MRQRLISAAIGIPIAIAVLFFYNTVLLNCAMALVTLFAVYEVFVATKYLENRGLVVICLIFASFAPFYHIYRLRILSEAVSFLFIFVLFVFLMFNHRKMKFETIGTVFMLSMLLSFSFSCIVFMRDLFAQRNAVDDLGLFYILLVFLGAWITDAGAYFIGRFFGKTKLSPSISPNKTVEGAFGGIACALIAFVASALIFQRYAAFRGSALTVHFLPLIAASLLSSVAAIIGDLSASLIKRECNVKDFGNILPGHGGVLDRFDSIMFVAPLIYIFIQIFPILN